MLTREDWCFVEICLKSSLFAVTTRRCGVFWWKAIPFLTESNGWCGKGLNSAEIDDGAKIKLRPPGNSERFLSFNRPFLSFSFRMPALLFASRFKGHTPRYYTYSFLILRLYVDDDDVGFWRNGGCGRAIFPVVSYLSHFDVRDTWMCILNVHWGYPMAY